MSELKYFRRKFDKNGVFVTSGVYEPVRDAGTGNEKATRAWFRGADMVKSIEPAFREQTVKAEYIPVNELIPQGDFPGSAFLSGKPIWWIGQAETERAGSGTETFGSTGGLRPRRIYIEDTSRQYAMQFAGKPVRTFESAKFVTHPAVPLKKETGMEIELSFDLRMKSVGGFYKVDVLVFYEVLCGSGFNFQWLSAEPLQWQGARASNSIFVGIDDYNNWITYKVTMPSPPVDGDFSVRFYQAVFFDPAKFPEYPTGNHRPRGERTWDGTLQIDNISAKLLYSGSGPAKESSETFVNSRNLSLVPPVVVTPYADVPPYLNAKLIYPYAWKVKGELTKEWTRRNYEEEQQLVDLILNARVEASQVAHEKISGTLDGDLSPIDYIRITYHDNKIYKINAFSWDLRDRTVSVELIEVLSGLPVQLDYILTEDRKIVLTEDNTATITEKIA